MLCDIFIQENYKNNKVTHIITLYSIKLFKKKDYYLLQHLLTFKKIRHLKTGNILRSIYI